MILINNRPAQPVVVFRKAQNGHITIDKGFIIGYSGIMININTNNRLRWIRNAQDSVDVFTRSDGQFRIVVIRGVGGRPYRFHDSRRRVPAGTSWLEQNVNGEWEDLGEFESERLAQRSIQN